MTIQEVHCLPTVEIYHLLIDSIKNNNQSLVNIYAYELATRIYVPNNNLGTTFDDLLTSFGYYKESEVERKNQVKVRKLI